MDRSLLRRVRRVEARTWTGEAFARAYAKFSNEGMLPSNRKRAEQITRLASRITRLLYDEDPENSDELTESLLAPGHRLS